MVIIQSRVCVQESKGSALCAIKDENPRTRWSYSIVERAHLAVALVVLHLRCSVTLTAFSLGRSLPKTFLRSKYSTAG